jgi:uncharacterized membrane protein YgcG
MTAMNPTGYVMKFMKIGCCFAFLLLLPIGVLATAYGQQLQDISGHSEKASVLEVPLNRDRVMDLANVLETAEIDVLKGKMTFLQLATTTQLGILIIPDLQGEVLEKYSLRVANKWKLGRCDINNGILILVAVKNRTLRIEVGLGLESILSDEACKRIIEESITPFFKAGDFYGGLDSGVTSIAKILTSSQEYKDIYSRPCKCSDGTGSELNE